MRITPIKAATSHSTWVPFRGSLVRVRTNMLSHRTAMFGFRKGVKFSPILTTKTVKS